MTELIKKLTTKVIVFNLTTLSQTRSFKRPGVAIIISTPSKTLSTCIFRSPPPYKHTLNKCICKASSRVGDKIRHPGPLRCELGLKKSFEYELELLLDLTQSYQGSKLGSQELLNNQEAGLETKRLGSRPRPFPLPHIKVEVSLEQKKPRFRES
uniref:Uncharacterized protein n=1 Tax=Romanomermis culicivorax TaxID=13658 RepID=A0A915LDE2_ROMCU